MTARDLWVEFASRCEEKDWISDRLAELLADDGYGVRDCLLEAGPLYLTQAHLRSLADGFWDQAQRETQSKHSNDWYRLVGMVARALVDPALHERSTVAWCGGEVGGLYLSIASPAQNLARVATKAWCKWYPIARKRVVPYARKHWLPIGRNSTSCVGRWRRAPSCRLPGTLYTTPRIRLSPPPSG